MSEKRQLGPTGALEQGATPMCQNMYLHARNSRITPVRVGNSLTALSTLNLMALRFQRWTSNIEIGSALEISDLTHAGRVYPTRTTERIRTMFCMLTFCRCFGGCETEPPVRQPPDHDCETIRYVSPLGLSPFFGGNLLGNRMGVWRC